MLKGSVLCVECDLECGAAPRCCQHWHRLFAILFDNLYNRCRCRIEPLSRQVIVLFQASNTRFAQKIKEAQDKIQEIREKKQEALKHDTLLPTWLEEFKQYEHIKTLERRVVVELIDHIDVHSKTEIEIHFCFEDELHSITEKFMEYQAHHGNEVAEE